MGLQSLSLNEKKVADPCGILGQVFWPLVPTWQCFGKAVWTREIESGHMGGGGRCGLIWEEMAELEPWTRQCQQSKSA